MVSFTSIIPLIYISYFKSLGHIENGDVQSLYIYCHTNYYGSSKFTYGGYFQDTSEKCITFQTDDKDCDVPYGCANLRKVLLDFTWYGSKAVICDGIDLNKKFKFYENVTERITTSMAVTCTDHYGLPVSVFQTTKFFKLRKAFLPNWYATVLSRYANSEMYKIDKNWQHIQIIKLLKLNLMEFLPYISQLESPFIMISIPSYKFSYTCGYNKRVADIMLDSESCGQLLPINFTHGICSDTVLRYNPKRCFDDYKIKLLPDHYIFNKFIKEKPSGFVATIANEIVQSLLYLIQPVIEDLLMAIIKIIAKLIKAFSDILQDIMPSIINLLESAIEVVENFIEEILKLLEKIIALLIKLFKFIDQEFILTEVLLSFILSGLRFGYFRACLITVIVVYFFGFARNKIDFRKFIYDV